jgi:hypothetical protein
MRPLIGFFRVEIALLWVSTMLVSCVSDQELYKPTFVGRPPQNAFTGLVRLDNGEIRHYGRNLYIRSLDQGLSWDTVFIENGNLYGKQSPDNKEFLRLFSGPAGEVFSARSIGGIDGQWSVDLVDSSNAIMLKPPVFIRNGKRAIVGFHTRKRDGCGSYFSDDNGISWRKSNQVNVPRHEAGGFHKGPRWNHGAVEPTIIELKDGRLWMLIRTAQDNHYESFSEDGGESWSEPSPSRFYGTITMPTLHRLEDGKILLLWSNTTPLPELEHYSGYWEDVFTNRDAIHAAVSDDEGKTWNGFREIYLNPLRNDSLMATRFGEMGSLDRSVHQSECVELEDNNILISLGQHPEFRALIRMNVNWLYEKERRDDFSSGLEKWSVQSYLKGIKGHCAYNRNPGARLLEHPDASSKKVMHLMSELDTSLLYQNKGALFNFPAGTSGEVSFRIRFNKGFKGMNIHLHDRWFNPVDTVARHYAMVNLEIPGTLNINDGLVLTTDKWYDFKVTWEKINDTKEGVVSLQIDNRLITPKIPILNSSENGVSYIHLALPFTGDTNHGILLESISSQTDFSDS